MNRFAPHFNQLLNVPGTVDQEALDSLSDRPTDCSLDDIPSFVELLDAIAATRENKAPGECGIPASGVSFGAAVLSCRPNF